MKFLMLSIWEASCVWDVKIIAREMNKTPAPPFTFAGPAYTECMQAKRMVSLSLDDDQYLI